MKHINITGKRFGRLQVLTISHSTAQGYFYTCKCDCGHIRIISSSSLRRGVTKSCGCLAAEKVAERGHLRGRHFMSDKSEYEAWRNMRKRCYNPNHPDYPNYGGRGISVCPQWLTSFDSFFNDMGLKPSPTHSIDRINNNGNYEPLNCRWATPTQQANNKRKIKLKVPLPHSLQSAP